MLEHLFTIYNHILSPLNIQQNTSSSWLLSSRCIYVPSLSYFDEE